MSTFKTWGVFFLKSYYARSHFKKRGKSKKRRNGRGGRKEEPTAGETYFETYVVLSPSTSTNSDFGLIFNIPVTVGSAAGNEQ